MKVVLFVDDEKLVLMALKKIFDVNQYQYIFKSSALEALDYIASFNVDLICTDIAMPVMDGISLLRIVKDKHPQIVRVALTSMNRTQIIKKLTNENLAQLYLFKPWDNTELKLKIFKVLKTHSMLCSHEVMVTLQKLESIPTIPEIYKQLTEMLRKDNPVEDIAALIEEDQAITAVILRVANSAFYGRKTGNINQAIMNIGLDNLNSIILANAVFKEVSEDLETLKEMWAHASESNKIMTAIYNQCLKKNIPSLFASASLLHDIGKAILFHSCKEYRILLETASYDEQSLVSLEMNELGVTHQEIGGHLLNFWELPFAYVEVAMFHHRPLDFRVINRELVAVSHLAHYYSSRHANNHEGDQLDEKVFTLLKLKKEDVENMIEKELGWQLYE